MKAILCKPRPKNLTNVRTFWETMKHFFTDKGIKKKKNHVD